MSGRHVFRWIALLMLAPGFMAGCGRSSSVSGDSIDVRVLSNRSDLISDGNALVEVLAPDDVDLSLLTVTAAGTDQTAAFARDPARRILGLVEGLPLGSSRITVRLGKAEKSATVINHPSGGPLIAGPQLQPWTCRNPNALDAHCNQPPEYSYLYKPAGTLSLGLQTYDPNRPPQNVATTTTDQGVTVPYIVRVETGYLDRDQYRIAVLYQPGKPWTPANPQPQFNGKMLVNHGSSCGVDYQSADAPSVLPGMAVTLPGTTIGVATDAIDAALGKGYVVMSTALNNSGHNCNIALQAESLIMAKERVIEQYGSLRYTIGQGCSGGSLAIQWIANAYPGIYQGILPTCSFPDAWSTATQFADYHLLMAYFNSPAKWGAGVSWLPSQMADVEGHVTLLNAFVSELAQFHVAIPTDACAGVSDAERYDPQSNPGGVRCSIQDAAINIFAPRPSSLWGENEKAIGRGFAGFPVDNQGVQYGLSSLQRGVITPEQFVDLNEKLGGLDVDIVPTTSRTSAVEPALANAYRSGSINTASNLDETAIIDCRGPDPGLFHDAYRAYALRARLEREHGSHANQLIWEGPVPIFGDSACGLNSFLAMDRWLASVEKDESDLPLSQKIVSAKPMDLQDACYSGVGAKLFDGTCGPAVVPVYGTPRTVAGDAITTDNNKCQLKPLNRDDDYGRQGLSDAQWNRMMALFPAGVCDYSKLGVSHQATIPWQTYQRADGSVVYGGQALPKAPENSGKGWASSAFSVFR